MRAQTSSMNSLQALDCCHQCWDASYTKSTAIKGFAACGLRTNEIPDVEAIITQKPELFKSIVPVEERKYEDAQSAEVLPKPRGYERALASSKCSSCKKMVPSSQKFCGNCGKANDGYDSIQGSVAAGAKSQGYKRAPTQVVDMKDAMDFSPSRKRCCTKIWGDMISKVRNSASSSKPVQAAGQQAEPSKSEQAAGQHSDQPSKPEQAAGQQAALAEQHEDGAQSDGSEWDLNNEDDVAEYLTTVVKAKDLEILGLSVQQCDKVIRFYISTLKKKTPKRPLSDWIQHEKSGWDTTKKRQQWLRTFHSQRRAQFVQKTSK